MVAVTSIPSFANESVASVTSPSDEVGNPKAVAAPAVVAVTVPAPSSVLAVAVAAYGTAPVVPDALRGVCVRHCVFVGVSGEGGVCLTFLGNLEQSWNAVFY